MIGRRRRAGFTLVEILVVLVIIALVGGLAMMTLEHDERRLAAREAKRFAGALEFAAARAQARNETLGVSADRTIRFWRREPSGEKWLPLDDDVLGGLQSRRHAGRVKERRTACRPSAATED